MTIKSKRQPDKEGTTPPPPRPRRLPSNRESSSRRQQSLEEPTNNKQQLKQQQNETLQSKTSRKLAEDAATRLARSRSLEDSEETNYDSDRWEMLVSKQEELMAGFVDEYQEDQPKRKSKSSSSNNNKSKRVEQDIAMTPPPLLGPAPTSLLPNQRGIQEHILPGAFRMRPSMGAMPAVGLEEGDRDGFLTQEESRRSVIATEKEETIRGGDVLIEAELVNDLELPSSSNNKSNHHSSKPEPIYPEPELVMGEPMSPMKPSLLLLEAGDDERSRRLKWILLSLCVLVSFLVVAGAILGARAGRKEEEEDTGPKTGVPFQEDDFFDLPTLAPTAFTQDLLPALTQQSLNDPNSPQSQAYDWLVQDLQQQETTQNNMEDFFPLQRFVLATLYYALQGSTWKANELWLEPGTDPCDWESASYGSVCSGNGQRNLRSLQQKRRNYERLSLFQNNLKGTLPPEIGLLSKLDVVDLHENAISGSIPSQLGLWRDVSHLQLFNNSMTGTLPAQLAELKKIRHLNLAFNQLSGSIPVELSQLSSTLEVFSVSNNRIKGSIPTEMGLLENLEGLYLYSNPYLGGTLPSEIGQLARLLKLQLDGIGLLTGVIPTELGLLSLMQEIQLQDTKLQGSIPSTLGALSQLTKLSLHNTELSGSVPEEVCSLVRAGTLQDLSVDCDKVQCPSDCQCDCGDHIPRSDESQESVVVAEAFTDPPIRLHEEVVDPPTPDVAVTSAVVGSTTQEGTVDRPRPGGQ